jgi:hypothetical protein
MTEAAPATLTEDRHVDYAGDLRAADGGASTWRVAPRPIMSTQWRDIVDMRTGTALIQGER